VSSRDSLNGQKTGADPLQDYPGLRWWRDHGHATATVTASREPGDDTALEEAYAAATQTVAIDAPAVAAAKINYQCNLTPAATFFGVRRKHTFLIRRALVKGEPAMIVGPEKSEKTLISLDMAISLDSGRPFLGEFDVYRRQRVAFLSGESGEVTLEQAGRRICEAKRLDPCALSILFGFDLPQLSNAAHLGEVSAAIKREGIEVVFVDPAYLCLLDGAQDLSAANMFQVGPLLRAFARACLEAGATPILIHHANRQLKVGERMELSHIAYSGFGQWARQWVFLNHREPFDAETATAKLFMRAGGSAGAGGDWFVDIEEGRLSEFGDGRHWKVAVATVSEGIQAAKEEARGRQNAKAEERARANDSRFLQALDALAFRGETPTKAAIRARATLGADTAGDCILRLTQEGVIDAVAISIQSGTGSSVSRPGVGYRRAGRESENAPTATVRLSDGLSDGTDSRTVVPEATTDCPTDRS
jgi:hypothetical protein